MADYFERYLGQVKWTLPALFIIGYSLTFRTFYDNPLEYFSYNLLAAVSCTILLLHIRLFDQNLVAVWVAFILFIFLYFVRFYWITIDPTPVRDMLPRLQYKAMVESQVSQLRAFKLSVLAFAGFSWSTAALLSYTKRKNAGNDQFFESTDSTVSGTLARPMLFATTLLALALAYFTYKYNIGEMGASSGDALPFRLKGLIFYAKTVFIPLAILLSIYLAERCGDLTISRLGMSVLVMNGVVDMMLRSSRSGLLLSLVLLVFLMLADGIRLRRKEKLIFTVLLTLALIMVPFMTDYRYIRMNSGLSHLETFFGALDLAKNKELKELFKGIQFVMFRMPGVESLWCMIASSAEPLGIHSLEILNSQNGIARYLTSTIYPIKASDNTLLAPGFIGWFYLVAGWPAIVAGAGLTGILSAQAWIFLSRRYLVTGPVAKVFFLWMLFMALTEGTLDGMFWMFFVGMATIVTLEAGMRFHKKIRAYRAPP